MRSLTPAEARVIQALLGVVAGDEVDRHRQSGVPRTTFQTIRRRAFVAGWLRERYIPAPAAVGARRVRFWLAQPSAERRAEVIRRCREAPGCVVLWASPDTVLSVSFEMGSGEAERGEADPSPGSVPEEWLRRSWPLRVVPDPAELPIYFDHEGAWARRIGASSTISYPQSLPTGTSGAAVPSRAALGALLARPFETEMEEGLTLRFSAAHLPRRQRHLLEEGWATRRVLPDLAEIPSYRGGRDERVVFVTGRLREGRSLATLRERLYRECQVAPFLAAQDRGRVLLATLSPSPPGALPRGGSVLDLFQVCLREIEVIREPIDTMFAVLDHRYRSPRRGHPGTATRDPEPVEVSPYLFPRERRGRGAARAGFGERSDGGPALSQNVSK